MEHWLGNTVLPSAIAAGLLLLVLWPTRHSGTRVLQRWGVQRPEPAQVTEAVRYLRQRRVLYVALFLLFPSVAGAVLADDGRGMVAIFVPLLVAMLVAESVASLRPVSGVRSASLDRRTWRDLVPRWAVRLSVGWALVTAGLAVAGASWLALGYVLACLFLVSGLVALAVRRPAVADEAVDAALRTRTARVAVGIGFGWLSIALTIAASRLEDRWVTGWEAYGPGTTLITIAHVAVVVSALVFWSWVAMPSTRSPVRIPRVVVDPDRA